MSSVNVQVELGLQLPDDSGNVRSVVIAAAKDWHRPVPSCAAWRPYDPTEVNVRYLASQLGNGIEPLKQHGLQLLGGAGGFWHWIKVLKGWRLARARVLRPSYGKEG